MDQGALFSRIRGSVFGAPIRKLIADWPGYQNIPEPFSADLMRSRVRASLSLLSQILTHSESSKERLSRLKKLKASQSGNILLIGNGPSASSLTLGQINNFRKFGGKVAVMNRFYKSILASQIEPDYYFITDPEHWNPVSYSTLNLKAELIEYFANVSSDCCLVQPAQNPDLVASHRNYLYIDGRSAQGLWRGRSPVRPWGLPASVAMIAISTLQYLGYKRIYFTGLDSNFLSFFEVDSLNKVVNPGVGQHFYKADAGQEDLQKLIDENHKLPYRNMADLHFAHGIFLRDLRFLVGDSCINVGGDKSNDVSPRACLLG